MATAGGPVALPVGDVPRRAEVRPAGPQLCVGLGGERLESGTARVGGRRPLQLRRSRDLDAVRISALGDDLGAVPRAGAAALGGRGSVRFVLYAVSTLHATEVMESARRLGWEM